VIRLRLVPVVLALGALTLGCQSNTEASPVASHASSSPHARLVLKPAAGRPLITFTGRVNSGRPLAADMASFNALPTQTLTVLEPFVKKRQTFSGVSFADVLEAAGASGSTVTIHALDDYETTLSAKVLRSSGVLLATRVGGKAIGLDAGGPVRMVFPASAKIGKDTDQWVWSIDHITVA
jgi:hypothetical protein